MDLVTLFLCNKFGLVPAGTAPADTSQFWAWGQWPFGGSAGLRTQGIFWHMRFGRQSYGNGIVSACACVCVRVCACVCVCVWKTSTAVKARTICNMGGVTSWFFCIIPLPATWGIECVGISAAEQGCHKPGHTRCFCDFLGGDELG